MRVFVPYNEVDNDDEVVIKCSVNGGDWEEKGAIFQPGLLKDLKVHITIVKSMQRSGTEAIRTQIQPSKPKREITYITNSQNTKRPYGQPSEQLFSER